MAKFKKRLMSFTLVMVLAICVLPINTFAFDQGKDGVGTEDGEEIISTGETSISIQDDIANSGCLKAVISGLKNGITVESYRWTLADNTPISYKLLENGLIIDPDSSELFVAYDGSQKTYKVTVTLSDGTVFTKTEMVKYYDELMNGDFENNVVPATGKYTIEGYGINLTSGSRWIAVPVSDPNLYWSTTDATQRVEISDGTTAIGAYKTTRLDQFAELNYINYGAIYQDVLTCPGQTLYWGFEHSGRYTKDTMQLIIDNVTAIPDNWNPANTQWNESNVQYTATDGVDSWTRYTGTYIVPEGQYVTRFYFVSCDGTSKSMGNLLDNVTFSSTQPEIDTSVIDFTVNYYVDGKLDSSDNSGSAQPGTTVYPATDKVNAYAGRYDADPDNKDRLLVKKGQDNVINLYYTTPAYQVEYYIWNTDTEEYTKLADSDLVIEGTAPYGTLIDNTTVGAPDKLTIDSLSYSYEKTDSITMNRDGLNTLKIYYLKDTVMSPEDPDKETPEVEADEDIQDPTPTPEVEADEDTQNPAPRPTPKPEVEADVDDTLDYIPDTGDSSNANLWKLLMGLSIAGIAFCMIDQKKKHCNGEHIVK